MGSDGRRGGLRTPPSRQRILHRYYTVRPDHHPPRRKPQQYRVRGGGLEPPRVFSPLAPQTSASANSAILAQIGRSPDGRLVLTKRPGAVEAGTAGGRYLSGSRALRQALRLR